MKEFLEEIWEETRDFFEDFWDHVLKKPDHIKKTKVAEIGGVAVKVRPAYLFAERVDNLLKVIFGISISISAFTATFLGFSSLSELVDFLVNSLWGRVAMLIIGISYLVIAIWKLLHLQDNKA